MRIKIWCERHPEHPEMWRVAHQPEGGQPEYLIRYERRPDNLTWNVNVDKIRAYNPELTLENLGVTE